MLVKTIALVQKPISDILINKSLIMVTCQGNLSASSGVCMFRASGILMNSISSNQDRQSLRIRWLIVLMLSLWMSGNVNNVLVSACVCVCVCSQRNQTWITTLFMTAVTDSKTLFMGKRILASVWGWIDFLLSDSRGPNRSLIFCCSFFVLMAALSSLGKVTITACLRLDECY